MQVPVALEQDVAVPLQTKVFGWNVQPDAPDWQHDAEVPLLAPSSQSSVRSGFAAESITPSPQSE